MSIRVVQVPESFPLKWDLADPPPPDTDLEALLASAVERPRGPIGRLQKHITSAADLVLQEIPPREYVVDPFLPSSSLSMIYAARGIGKTWFALSLAMAISRGQDFLTFEVPKQRTVLLVDGEMTLSDLQSRIKSLDPQPPPSLLILPSERLFREDRPLNINSPEDQAAVEQAIDALRTEGRGPEVIIFDNLSSLSGGIDENDNSALDALLRWLVGLRHKGLAVMLVHHAGKSGDQRGASRREDLLDTSIKLFKRKASDDEDEPPPGDGATFMVEFVKTRGKLPNPSTFELSLEEKPDGTLGWVLASGAPVSPKDRVLRAIALDEPTSQQKLAEILDKSKGHVSQMCKALRAGDFIDGLALTEKGRERILRLWPELTERLAVQDDLPI